MLIGVTAQELIDVVCSAVAGNLEALPVVHKGLDATRLGGTTDLSRREVDVLRVVAQGRAKSEISATPLLSINSVMTYIRSAYARSV